MDPARDPTDYDGSVQENDSDELVAAGAAPHDARSVRLEREIVDLENADGHELAQLRSGCALELSGRMPAAAVRLRGEAG
jgi:hypothetical protein